MTCRHAPPPILSVTTVSAAHQDSCHDYASAAEGSLVMQSLSSGRWVCEELRTGALTSPGVTPEASEQMWLWMNY